MNRRSRVRRSVMWLAPLALAVIAVLVGAVVFAPTSIDEPLDNGVLPSDDDGSGAPRIVVTKSEISYQGKLVATTTSVRDGRTFAPPPSHPIHCDIVIEKLKQAVADVNPGIAVIASTKAPIVLSSCIYEGWPEPLKECIVTASASEIAAHRCDALVPDDIAQKLIDRLAPGQRISPRDFLQR